MRGHPCADQVDTVCPCDEGIVSAELQSDTCEATLESVGVRLTQCCEASADIADELAPG